MLPYLKGYGLLYFVTVPVRYSHVHSYMQNGEAFHRPIRNSTREIDVKKGRGNSEMR